MRKESFLNYLIEAFEKSKRIRIAETLIKHGGKFIEKEAAILVDTLKVNGLSIGDVIKGPRIGKQLIAGFIKMPGRTAYGKGVKIEGIFCALLDPKKWNYYVKKRTGLYKSILKTSELDRSPILVYPIERVHTYKELLKMGYYE
ncbi:MAG: hypothetical protein NT136_00910 [Candidatus Moranbacteria bacterium]|nr:hypothetical protein [Candidatus Moranbacteria bacterium]